MKYGFRLEFTNYWFLIAFKRIDVIIYVYLPVSSCGCGIMLDKKVLTSPLSNKRKKKRFK